MPIVNKKKDFILNKLYMAYGSNLNLAQMKQRCPKARQLGSFYLPNYRLVFRGVADIEPTKDSDSLLPVGVWQITEECERALDIYEGVKRELYRKEYINGILTYRMNTTEIFPPSREYFTSILIGYNNFGLNPAHLYDALGWSHYSDSLQDYTQYA